MAPRLEVTMDSRDPLRFAWVALVPLIPAAVALVLLYQAHL
jgi:hypothetical protein